MYIYRLLKILIYIQKPQKQSSIICLVLHSNDSFYQTKN